MLAVNLFHNQSKAYQESHQMSNQMFHGTIISPLAGVPPVIFVLNFRVRFNFSKMIREFFVKTTAKLNLNLGRHGWARKKIFHSLLFKKQP